MKIRIIFIVSTFVLLVSAYGPGNQPSGKTISSNKLSVNLENSRVNWTGKKPAGEHQGYVKLSGGEILLDKNEFKGGSFSFDMNSITDIDLSDDNYKTKLIGHLKSPDFFDVEKYPTAKFVITKVTKLPVDKTNTGDIKSTHEIEGELTMKNVTKKITFDASINVLKGKVTATSLPFQIDRTQWGVNYQSKSIVAGLKDQFIFDDITLAIDVVTE